MSQINPDSMTDSVIETRHLTHRIRTNARDIQVLHEINLQIERGQQVAITGRSGSGKSTLLSLLAALEVPTQGEIFLCGHPIHQYGEKQRAALRLQLIGFIFQSFQLLPQLSALENVLLPLRLADGLPRVKALERAQTLLERVGLSAQQHHPAKVLSGGEQQRVAIARALVLTPQIIFADEPTGNLDGETAATIEDLLFELNREQGTTLVLATHDQALATRCERRFNLHDGSLHELQRSDEVGLAHEEQRP